MSRPLPREISPCQAAQLAIDQAHHLFPGRRIPRTPGPQQSRDRCLRSTHAFPSILVRRGFSFPVCEGPRPLISLTKSEDIMKIKSLLLPLTVGVVLAQSGAPPTVTYLLDSSWQTGLQGEITIGNPGSTTLNNWSLQFT